MHRYNPQFEVIRSQHCQHQVEIAENDLKGVQYEVMQIDFFFYIYSNIRPALGSLFRIESFELYINPRPYQTTRRLFLVDGVALSLRS